MNKKILILLLVIAAVVAAGYYFFYQKPFKGPTPSETEEALEEEECGALTNTIIDGVFQKSENNFIYLQPKGKEDSFEAVKLTKETAFLEMAFSKEMEITGQKMIELADFKPGDQVSVIALYDEAKPGIKTALVVRHMVVEPENN